MRDHQRFPLVLQLLEDGDGAVGDAVLRQTILAISFASYFFEYS